MEEQMEQEVACCDVAQVLCSRMQDASQWPKGHLMTHTLVLITLCMFSWSRFWLRQLIGLVFPVPATDCYMLIASRVGMAYMLILAGASPSFPSAIQW